MDNICYISLWKMENTYREIRIISEVLPIYFSIMTYGQYVDSSNYFFSPPLICICTSYLVHHKYKPYPKKNVNYILRLGLLSKIKLLKKILVGFGYQNFVVANFLGE